MPLSGPLLTLLDPQDGHRLIHCDVGAQFLAPSAPYTQFYSQGRWMTQEQVPHGSPLPDLYVDILEPGSRSMISRKLVTGRAGQVVYHKEIKGNIDAEFRFRTSLIDPLTSIDKGTSTSVRAIRPQVGYRDLDSEWAGASELDIDEDSKLFEQALLFLFDRPNPRPGIKMNVTIPGAETPFRYTRGSPLSKAIISAFAALTQASGLLEDGPPAMVVVEASEDHSVSMANVGVSMVSNATLADEDAFSTEGTPATTPAVAPALLLVSDPLKEQWQQPNVQMFHRVPGKGLCSHVLQTNKASTESNTRFRATQVSEECLICGQHIYPSTELGIREHYREHRERLAILEAGLRSQVENSTVPTTTPPQPQHYDQATAPALPIVDNIPARLRENMPRQATKPEVTRGQQSNPPPRTTETTAGAAKS